MKLAKLGILVLVGTGLLTGCGVKKQLDEMHDATMDLRDTSKQLQENTAGMKGTTEKMAGTTDGLSTKTTGLGEVTSEMYDGLKQGNTFMIRDAALRQLKENPDMGQKIKAACAYNAAQDFQLWSGLGQDVQKAREFDAAQAMIEYFKDIHGFVVDGDLEPHPLQEEITGKLFGFYRQESTANNVKAFNAMALCIYKTNPKQDEMLAKHPEMKEMTFRSILKESLMAGKLIREGSKKLEDFPPYVKEVLLYEEVAIALLQGHMNMAAAVALERVSPISNGAIPYLKMNFGSWTMNLKKYNEIEINEFSRYINEGTLQTAEFLLSLGVKPKFDSQLVKMYDHMKIAATPNTLKGVVATRLGAEKNFIGGLKQFIKTAHQYR